METNRPKKFAVTSRTPPYEPSRRASPRFLIHKAFSSVSQVSSESHRLFIGAKARKQIFDHIGWGKRTDRNIVEQGGILLGQVFRDELQELTYGIVEAAAPGNLAKGSSAFLEMTHETWKEMLDSVDEMLLQNPDQKLQVIGWYHTHPNELSVFMSGTDLATQRRLFFHDWQFAIVMNPHHQKWKAFFGANAMECKGFVLHENQEEGDGNEPPVFADDVKSQDSLNSLQSAEERNAASVNQVRASNRSFDNNEINPKTLKWILLAFGLVILILLILQVISLAPRIL